MVGPVGHGLNLEASLGFILVVLLVMCPHTSSIPFQGCSDKAISITAEAIKNCR